MDGSHKLEIFDETLEEIQRNLEKKETTGIRAHMAETHGDFTKQCVRQKYVKIFKIDTKKNIADIMTQPSEFQTHRRSRNKISRMSL